MSICRDCRPFRRLTCSPASISMLSRAYERAGPIISYSCLLLVICGTAFCINPSVARLPVCHAVRSNTTEHSNGNHSMENDSSVHFVVECMQGEALGLLIYYGFAFFLGALCERIRIPGLLGHLLGGIVLRNINVYVSQSYEFMENQLLINATSNDPINIVDIRTRVTALLLVRPKLSGLLRQLALAVILSRAGLGLDPNSLKKVAKSVLCLSFIPCLTEAFCLSVTTRLLIGWPWAWGAILGFVCAAVSPAIIVPYMMRLEAAGWGVGEGIPTMIVAAASLDDIVAITGFGVALTIGLDTGDNLIATIFRGPAEALIGIIVGALVSAILCVIPYPKLEHSDVIRGILLAGLAVTAVIGSVIVNVSGAGALACLMMTFLVANGWRAGYPWRFVHSSDKFSNAPLETYITKSTRHINGESSNSDMPNPVYSTIPGNLQVENDDRRRGAAIEKGRACLKTTSHVFATLWWFMQPMLFCLIGSEVDLSRLSGKNTGFGFLSVMIALVVRFIASILAVVPSKLNFKERLFVGFAWLPKATVQAAIGPVALDTARELNASPEIIAYAEQVLTMAALTILVTAPLGAVLIVLTAPRLLTKNVESSRIPVADCTRI